MKKFEIEGHEPSFLPEGEWELIFSDEFDGDTLDRSKWDFRLDFWGKRFEAYTDEGVRLDGKGTLRSIAWRRTVSMFPHSCKRAPIPLTRP